MARGRRRFARDIWRLTPAQWAFVALGAFLFFSLASVAMWKNPDHAPATALEQVDVDAWLDQVIGLRRPVREAPRRFPPRTSMPNRREEAVCGLPRPDQFDASRDLIRIEDPRVWWESENDKRDTEDDHLFHRSMETPMKRLIELVTAAGGTLKVQDAYRPEGIHKTLSLHREGRAVDLTCDELGLEKLAQLAWAAGFDWVYHEIPRNGGAHVHASVRADGPGYLVMSK